VALQARFFLKQISEGDVQMQRGTVLGGRKILRQYAITAMIALALMLGAVFLQVAEATTRTDTIHRETKSWVVSPGDPDIFDIYYYPDGRGATAQWWSSWFPFVNGTDPFIVMSIYYYSSSQGWVFLTSGNVDPFGGQFNMYLTTGKYLLEMKIYHQPGNKDPQATGVSIQVR